MTPEDKDEILRRAERSYRMLTAYGQKLLECCDRIRQTAPPHLPDDLKDCSTEMAAEVFDVMRRIDKMRQVMKL